MSAQGRLSHTGRKTILQKIILHALKSQHFRLQYVLHSKVLQYVIISPRGPPSCRIHIKEFAMSQSLARHLLMSETSDGALLLALPR